MGGYVLTFAEIDRTHVALVGGKGANLGELSRLDGIRVPAGFCVTTEAYRRAVATIPWFDDHLDRLSHLRLEDRDAIQALSLELRRAIEALVIPPEVSAAIARSLSGVGKEVAFAVRSSANAEDSPTASFAGQQDTYLNVVGPAAVLLHISRCWGSLFSERAVTYRIHNGFDHRKVQMAVVVQRMVFAQAAGTLFTAEPVMGNRKVLVVEASFGLGDAMISGLVNADVYRVRDGLVISQEIATKQLAIQASPEGGTQAQAIKAERQQEPALNEAQVLRLAELGRRIEAHFARPQDIEWCLSNDEFQIVQSRPITTLFPIPAVEDGENHVYVSVGHQQMMTDPMKPLGLSFFLLTTPATMYEAGGRLFVDVSRALASPGTRSGLLRGLGKSDPLIGDALTTIIERGDFIRALPNDETSGARGTGAKTLIDADPAIVRELIGRSQASISALERDIQPRSGSPLIEFILADLQELRRTLFDPKSHQVIVTAMEATWWLNEQLQPWLGEQNAGDALTQSVPHNVTSEMGLELLGVADVIRRYPEVVSFLQQVKDDSFLDELDALPGGREARAAIRAYLDKYGMRCVGEIDITRPRFSERPSMLLPVILSHIKNFESGAGKQRFEQGRADAERKEQELLERVRALPDGQVKATEVKRMIDRVRTFIGYREYPKYSMVTRYFVYKRALLREAEHLTQAKVLQDSEDIFYLTLQELQVVVQTNEVDDQLIRRRKEAFRFYETLTPPRVLTSDGEILNGAYRRDDVPAGALVGLAVSPGTVQGRARVVLNFEEADLEAGDILVTRYTDPSWTPLFVAIQALVTEVGGLMTHGAVIAREYGLPAVVGVERATQRIQDGQLIRVHGTEGYVELLS